jgi:putative transcriptional regulator
MSRKNFERIMEGLNEAVVHTHGDDVPRMRVHIPAGIDTKAIRKAVGDLTQAEFADRYGFSRGAVRDWEQGRKVPDQSTREYLKVIAEAPRVVERARSDDCPMKEKRSAWVALKQKGDWWEAITPGVHHVPVYELSRDRAISAAAAAVQAKSDEVAAVVAGGLHVGSPTPIMRKSFDLVEVSYFADSSVICRHELHYATSPQGVFGFCFDCQAAATLESLKEGGGLIRGLFPPEIMRSLLQQAELAGA